MLKKFIRNIRKIIIWLPVIWNDENWDSAYLFEIMRFKISLMRKHIDKEARHINYKKDVKNMMIAEQLLKRQSFSDFYYENDEKNKEFCKCNPKNFSNCWIEKDGHLEYKSPFCSWCSMKTQILRRDKKENEDLNFLFNHLRRHSRKWWN